MRWRTWGPRTLAAVGATADSPAIAMAGGFLAPARRRLARSLNIGTGSKGPAAPIDAPPLKTAMPVRDKSETARRLIHATALGGSTPVAMLSPYHPRRSGSPAPPHRVGRDGGGPL